jgi:hypothetical protein
MLCSLLLPTSPSGRYRLVAQTTSGDLFISAKDLFVEANSRQGWPRQVQPHLNEASRLPTDAGLSLLSSSRAEAGHTSIRDQAIFCRRRHQPRRPPLAKIRPGRPAPAMGPGTLAGRAVSKSYSKNTDALANVFRFVRRLPPPPTNAYCVAVVASSWNVPGPRKSAKLPVIVRGDAAGERFAEKEVL